MAKDQPDVSPAPPAPKVVTPLEIQQREFRVSRFGGYRMRDVDEFLDQITETVGSMIAENERLRRQIGAAPVVGSPDLDDVSRQADEIIQRARDEAARVVAEARERTAAIAGASAAGGVASVTDRERAAVDAFLNQERDFLQSLAGLVQGHAESVKGMARKARSTPATPVTADAPAEAPTAQEAAAEEPADEPENEPERGSDADDGSSEEEASEPDDTRVVGGPADATIELTEADRPTTVPREPGEGSLRDLFWGGKED
jgi:DivIVA domain-containing protein